MIYYILTACCIYLVIKTLLTILSSFTVFKSKFLFIESITFNILESIVFAFILIYVTQFFLFTNDVFTYILPESILRFLLLLSLVGLSFFTAGLIVLRNLQDISQLKVNIFNILKRLSIYTFIGIVCLYEVSKPNILQSNFTKNIILISSAIILASFHGFIDSKQNRLKQIVFVTTLLLIGGTLVLLIPESGTTLIVIIAFVFYAAQYVLSSIFSLLLIRLGKKKITSSPVQQEVQRKDEELHNEIRKAGKGFLLSLTNTIENKPEEIKEDILLTSLESSELSESSDSKKANLSKVKELRKKTTISLTSLRK